MKINMHEAKSQLSKLGEKAWQGETIVIAKAGKPYLDLLPHKERRTTRKPGLLKGQIKNTYGTGCFVVLNTGKVLIIS